MLEPEGVDFLEILAERVRAVTQLPIMVTGGFRSRAAMIEALRSNALDVVGLARPLALEPDLPARKTSAPLKEMDGLSR